MIDDFIILRKMIENIIQAGQNYQNQKKKSEDDSKKQDL